MAVIETWLHQDLQEPVKVNHLDGNLFSNNGNGNRIGVVLTNNGEDLASISGTVSGYVVTADGSTVPCTGSKSGNRASILIPAAAYQPGSIFITVFVTDGTTVTTIGAVSTTVMRSRTNAQVDPGSAVTDWTQTINAAMQSVETAAANLGGIVAVPYASITFPVPLGKYTYYNNNLYRCITPIASSESFTAAHWTQVRLGDDVSDLKSALTNTNNDVFSLIALNQGYITSNLDIVTSNTGHKYSDPIMLIPGDEINLFAYGYGTSVCHIAKCNSNGTLTDVLVLSNGTEEWKTYKNTGSSLIWVVVCANINDHQPMVAIKGNGIYTELYSEMQEIGSNSQSITIINNQIKQLGQSNYRVQISEQNKKYPFYAKSGDSITVSTVDGSTMTAGSVRFYKADGTYEWWGLSGYGSKRTFTIDPNLVLFYVDIATINGQTLYVTNNSSWFNWHDDVDNTNNALSNYEEEIDQRVFGTIPEVKIGYLGEDNGAIYSQSSGDNRYIVYKHLHGGEKFKYTGKYGNTTDWGLAYSISSNGTATKLFGGAKQNYVFTVPNDCVELRAWSDCSEGYDLSLICIDTVDYRLDSLEKSVIPRYIVVDAAGDGQFTDIQSAIDYAKNNFDVTNESVTIYVKNGIYPVTPDAESPYYAINKGGNKISIIGESRDGVIIRCTCTSERQGIALNIGGTCTIENLSIENLADASYTSETTLEGHRPYCLHNDSYGEDETKPYYTTVKNVKCYSECDTPIGAGMHNNQIQRYENVECIYAEDAVIKQQGAFYLHGPYNENFIPIGAEIVDCVFISKNTQYAISMPNVSGTKPWSEISQTFIRNVTYSAGSYEVSLASTTSITPYSKGNTNSTLNK